MLTSSSGRDGALFERTFLRSQPIEDGYVCDVVTKVFLGLEVKTCIRRRFCGEFDKLIYHSLLQRFAAIYTLTGILSTLSPSFRSIPSLFIAEWFIAMHW
jgi:hypothetical protein